MSRTLLVVVAVAGLFSAPAGFVSSASAEEQHEKFLDGLRSRRYYDYALYYLDKLESRTDLDADVKAVIPYQRAITMLDGASSINNPEVRDEQLDRAVAQLEAFTRANPDHPLAAKANTEQARILIEKARVKIWEADSPANQDNADKFRLEARDLLTKARETFQTAHDQHKAVFDKFPKFIPKEDKEEYEARSKAEIAYMRAQIDLALCTYEEAQTHPEGSQEFKNLLTKAAEEFKTIHEKYRSIVGGLYARMWQGKCFEEQNDIGKALGIYNELLAHPGKSGTMKTVQNQVLQFRLICLNHEDRKDYQLVVNEGGEWLDKNRKLVGTTVGLGIRYQKALGHESLADKLEKDFEAAMNKADRDNNPQKPLRPTAEIEGHLRKAMQEAQAVTEYAGQYRSPAQFMVSRVKGKLNLDEGPPKDINEALVKAEAMRQKIEVYEGEIEAAKTQQEKANYKEILDSHLNDTAEVLQLALKLADDKTDVLMLTKVRFLLSFVYYKLQRNYEAGVIGEFLAEHYAKNKEDTTGKLGGLAQNGAQVAIAAYFQEYSKKSEEQAGLPADQRDVGFELDQMLRACEMTVRIWPGTGLADQSRLTLGRIYSRREQFAEAAKWFSQVSTPEKKATAKVSAGQAYWNAYLNGVVAPEDKRPSQKELDSYKASAKKFLDEGIKAMNQDVPEEAPVNVATDLIAARVTLAQIFVNDQGYDEAIRYLTETKPLHHAPLDSVKLPDGTKSRPAKGVTSANFARLVYQVLLRAYVGKQQTDEALSAMDSLEQVVGKENNAQLSATYQQLGDEIRKEVERLQKEGPPERLQQILKSFETFLNALYDRSDKMSDGSLQWMAETYLNLGISLKESDSAKAKTYFDRSEACYEAILGRIDVDNPPKWATGMKLRLANASAAAGNYDKGLTKIEEVLKEYPHASNVQVAAAQLLEDWGAGQQVPDRLLESILGRKYEGQPDANGYGIKGWKGLANQYQQLLRPVRQALAQLRDQEQRIIAYQNTIAEKGSREAQVESLKSLNQDAKDAEDNLAVVTDALAATKEWMSLRREREALEAELQNIKDKKLQQEKLNRVEQINRFVSHMVNSQYYQDLTSGKVEKSYNEQIKELEKKNSKGDQEKIAQLKSFIGELGQEKELLAPAYRTGQRILRKRMQLALILEQEKEQLEANATLNPNSGATAMIAQINSRIDSIKPQGVDEKFVQTVKDEMEGLQNEGRGLTKKGVEKELDVLRDAVVTWTVFDLAEDKLLADGNAVDFDQLALGDAKLNGALKQVQSELGQQIQAQESKASGLYEDLMDVLYKSIQARIKYAEIIGSTPKQKEALQRAESDAGSLAQKVPRDDINAEWWNKFNSLYKEIRTDLNPLLDGDEKIDPNQDLPVPAQVSTNLTWIESPSNVAVTFKPNDDDDDDDKNAGTPAPGPNWLWIGIGVAVALAGTGAAVFFMMGSQKRPPVRVNYGSGPLGGNDEPISFPGGGFGESEPAAAPVIQSKPAAKPRPAAESQPAAKPRPKQPGPPQPKKKRPAPASGQAPPQAKRPRPKQAPPAAGEAPRKAAPKKRPPGSGGEPPKPRPKPRPSE